MKNFKNFALWLGVYLFGMAICGTGLVLNNAPGLNASGTGTPADPIKNPTVNIALIITMIVATLVIAALTTFILINRHKARKIPLL